jgi:hypothetical protein
MNSYLFESEDSEELFRVYDVVKPEYKTYASLAGMDDIFVLASANRQEDTLESVRNGGCFNEGLAGACWGGRKEMAQLMIERGAANFDWGLLGACLGGRINTAELMIEKGATNIQQGLERACDRGHMELTLLLIHKTESSGSLVEFGPLLTIACRDGHKEILGLIIQKIKSSGNVVGCQWCHKSLDKH